MLAYLFPLRFFHRLGATEVEPDTICNMAGHVAWGLLFGTSAVGFDPGELHGEPWSNVAVGVYVFIEADNDEVVALFEVEHGRWKELPVPN